MKSRILRCFTFAAQLAVAAMSLCARDPVWAVEPGDIRKEILEDCPRALEHLGDLKEKDRSELVPYLKLVLDLSGKVDSPALPNPPVIIGHQPPILSRMNPSLGQDLVRAVEPKRELAAKRCAVQIAERLGGLAFEVLPGLIRLSTDKTLPFDFQEELDGAVWAMSVEASRRGACTEIEPQFNEIFELLSDPAVLALPSNVFIQNGECSVKFLLDSLRTTDDELSRRIVDILRNIDSSGKLIGPAFLNFLKEDEPDLRSLALRVLGSLEGFYSEAVFPLLQQLRSPDGEDQREEFLDALRAFFAKKGLLPAQPRKDDILAILFDEMERLPEAERGVMQEGLEQFSDLAPRWHERLQRLANSPEASLRRRALVIMEGITLSEADIAFVLRKLGSDSSPEVQFAAFSVLGKRAAGSEAVVSAFRKVLKAGSGEDDVTLQQRRLCAVAESLKSFAARKTLHSKTFTPFSTWMLDVLKFRDFGSRLPYCSVAEEILAAYPDVSLPEVLHLLKDRDEFVRVRAISTLARMKPVPDKAVTPLLDLLKDEPSAIRAEAVHALGKMGPVAVPKLKLALKNADGASKIPYAQALLEAGFRGQEVREALTKTWPSASCDVQASVFSSLVALDRGLVRELNSQMLRCIEGAKLKKEPALAVIHSLGPVEKGSPGEVSLRRIVDGEAGEALTQVAMLKVAENLGVPRREVVDSALKLLPKVEDPFKASILEILSHYPEDGQRLVPVLAPFIEESRNDALSIQAIRALLDLKVPSYDYPAFVRSEFQSERAWVVEAAMRISLPQVVIPILSGLLDQDTPEIRRQILRLLGGINDPSNLAVPELQRFLATPRAPEERFLGIVAIFRVDPTLDSAVPLLRREMVGRFREQLLSQRFEEHEKQVVAGIAATPSSFLEQQTARAIVAGGRYP